MNAINYLKLFLFASTAMTQTAQAQTAAGNAPGAAPQAESPTVEADIVVTAQRREERLLDVPIAVSVINPALMERAGFQNINNMQAFVPNLQINQTVGNSFSPLITIRGLSPSSDTSLARDQPVGIYLDGVPIAKSTGSAFDTVELARVEVLRGPQGTLYGKNTIGGAVNLVSAEPTGEFGGTAWRDHQSGGVNAAARHEPFGGPTSNNLGNVIPTNGHVTIEPRVARAIHNAAVGNHEIVRFVRCGAAARRRGVQARAPRRERERHRTHGMHGEAAVREVVRLECHRVSSPPHHCARHGHHQPSPCA